MVKSAARRKTPPARLDAVFHALADATRRSILRGVAERPKTVGEIARPYRVSLAAVSKHLKVLERADLIRREKRGSFQIVRLNAAPMRAAEEWIRRYERFWNRQLDALQDLLDREDSR
ncbi:winged helix-turn-helix transcriptional regulator [bacterium]|nr:winged helix-turn-helix transcriptional regulator [bacterium]